MKRKKLKNIQKYKNRLPIQDKQTKTELNMTHENDLTPKSKTTKMLNDLHGDLSDSSIYR